MSVSRSQRIYSRTEYIEHNIKHYADRYVRTEDGYRLYRPYRVEVWWKRSNSNYTARDATVTWGCERCWNCQYGLYTNWFNAGPFTPEWLNSTTSRTYRYDRTWPELQPTSPIGILVQAASTAKAYKFSYYLGSTSVQAPFDGSQ